MMGRYMEPSHDDVDTSKHQCEGHLVVLLNRYSMLDDQSYCRSLSMQFTAEIIAEKLDAPL